MTETKQKKLPIAELIIEPVDLCKLISGQRYTFYRNYGVPIRGTFNSYNDDLPIPSANLIITHYSTGTRNLEGFLSLYFIYCVKKIYIDFQCLSKELNDIINEYY